MPTEDEIFRAAGIATSRPSEEDEVLETGHPLYGGPVVRANYAAEQAAQSGVGSDAPPVIGADLGDLGAGSFDGQTGIIRLGTYPDVTEIEFLWSDSLEMWISARETVILSTRDTWGVDFSNRALADFRNKYCRFYSGLPYGKDACSYLTSAQNLAALASNELAIHNSANFANSGSVRVRDQVLTYTGKAAGKLTGVSAGTGTFPADNTPVTQGQIGGWGTESAPLDRCDTLYEGGFELQERANAWLTGSQDEITMTVAPFYLNVDEAESFSLPATEPSGGLGMGVELTGPSDPGAANRAAERAFVWTDSGWTDFQADAPTKRFVIPHLYGKMNSAGAEDNGEVYGYTLRVRWVGTP